MAKSISKIKEEIRKSEEQLEERLDKIHGWLGEIIIDVLEIDYDMLDKKKDVEEIVYLIVNEMNDNPFSNSSNSIQNNNEVSDINDREENTE